MNAMNSNAPIQVKFMTKAPVDASRDNWIRKFPRNNPVWGRCHFTFDPLATEYDWLVVYDDLPPKAGERFTRWEEKLPCAPENTLLITTEPSTVKNYGQEDREVRQFGSIVDEQVSRNRRQNRRRPRHQPERAAGVGHVDKVENSGDDGVWIARREGGHDCVLAELVSDKHGRSHRVEHDGFAGVRPE